jgi:hypothetical protein
MAVFLPVSSHGLRRLTVVSDAAELRRATLLPFFDRQGEAPRVVIVDESSSEVLVFDPREAVLRFFGWWRLQIEGNVRRPTQDDLRLLKGLWHFDPWRLLASQNNAPQELAAVLKPTNAYGKLCDRAKRRQVRKLYYRRDLLRAVGAKYRKKGQSGLVFFSSCVLPERFPAAREMERERQDHWRLDPFWTRPFAAPASDARPQQESARDADEQSADSVAALSAGMGWLIVAPLLANRGNCNRDEAVR